MSRLQPIHAVVLCGWLVAAVSWFRGGPLHAADKVPIPSADDQSAASALVKDVYGEEHAKAANSEQKTALAQKLLQAAKGIHPGTANQYELLRTAWDLATQAGDATLAIQITDEIAGVFAVDAPSAKAGNAQDDRQIRTVFARNEPHWPPWLSGWLTTRLAATITTGHGNSPPSPWTLLERPGTGTSSNGSSPVRSSSKKRQRHTPKPKWPSRRSKTIRRIPLPIKRRENTTAS